MSFAVETAAVSAEKDLEFCLRAARASELDDVSALAHECLDHDAWTTGDLIAEWEKDGTWLWVAEAGGRVVGYALAHRIFDEAELLQLGVSPQVRRQGLGRLLVEALLDWAEQHAVLTVFLEVRASNDGAQALYTACGFEKIGRRRDYYQSPAEDCILMSRRYG